jgi:integrase
MVLVLVLAMAFLVKHPESRYWVAGFYDANGKRRRRSTKIEATERNRKQAMRIAGEYEAAARQIRTARQVRKVITDLHRELSGSELPTASVREYAREWIDRKKNEVKPSTLAYYQGKIRHFLKFLGTRANRDIAEVTNSDIVRFRDHLATKVTAKTTNHAVKAIKSLFADARLGGFVADDPAEGVRSVRTKSEEITEVRPFTIDELQSVLAIADPEWKSMIMFGVYSMLRLGDIARLKYSDLDWERKIIRLQVEKTGRWQMIPMAQPLIDFLCPEGDPPSLSNDPIHPKTFSIISPKGRTQTVSRQFATLLAKAGLREPVSHRKTGSGRDAKRNRHSLTFHSLRHTGNRLLANAGVDRELRKSLTGHTSESIHDGYTHLEIETRRAAVNTIPDLAARSPEKSADPKKT